MAKIEVVNLSYYVSVEMGWFDYEMKQLLHGIDLTFQPNTVTAIMGPSGAGKSILLSSLRAY
jgi:ABC-type phosphate transport system ATPase subunit